MRRGGGGEFLFSLPSGRKVWHSASLFTPIPYFEPLTAELNLDVKATATKTSVATNQNLSNRKKVNHFGFCKKYFVRLYK